MQSDPRPQGTQARGSRAWHRRGDIVGGSTRPVVRAGGGRRGGGLSVLGWGLACHWTRHADRRRLDSTLATAIDGQRHNRPVWKGQRRWVDCTAQTRDMRGANACAVCEAVREDEKLEAPLAHAADCG